MSEDTKEKTRFDELLEEHDHADVIVRKYASRITKAASGEAKPMTEEQHREFRAALRQRIDAHDAIVALTEGRDGTVAQARAPKPEARSCDKEHEHDEVRQLRKQLDEAEQRETAAAMEAGRLKLASSGGSTVNYGETTRWDRPLRKDQSFADLAPKRRTVEESGEFLRAFMNGDYEKRVGMTTGVAPGANAVPVDLTAPLLDLARSMMVTNRLGVSVVPMSAGTVGVPVHMGDPVASFRNELGAVAETGVTLEKRTLTAKSLDAMIRFSMELSQDSEFSIEQYLATVFAEAFARKLDAAILHGPQGTPPEVAGVYGASGVTMTPLGANGLLIPDFDAIIDLVSRCRGKNFEPSLVWSPRTESTLAKVLDGSTGSKNKLALPPYLADVPLLRSNQVKNDMAVGTSGNVCSSVFAGRWSTVLVGIRAELRIDVLQERYRDTGEFAAVAHMRADVQIARPSDLEVLTGIKAS